LASFWRFSITVSSLPSASPGADRRPLFPRSTLHAPRHPRRHPPGPAGSGRAQTLPRWLLPDTNRRFVKERTGPDRDEGPHYFSMSPNRAIGADKSIFFFALTAAQPLTILAWFNYGSLQSLRSRFIAAPASAVSGTTWMRDSGAERPSSA